MHDRQTSNARRFGLRQAAYIAHCTSHVSRFELKSMEPAHTHTACIASPNQTLKLLPQTCQNVSPPPRALVLTSTSYYHFLLLRDDIRIEAIAIIGIYCGKRPQRMILTYTWLRYRLQRAVIVAASTNVRPQTSNAHVRASLVKTRSHNTQQWHDCNASYTTKLGRSNCTPSFSCSSASVEQ